jgi:hypothetical protein
MIFIFKKMEKGVLSPKTKTNEEKQKKKFSSHPPCFFFTLHVSFYAPEQKNLKIRTEVWGIR